jgi:hypothetical protein
MLPRLHQERSAGVARERRRILCVFAVLYICNRTDILVIAAADYEAAALERKFTFRLRDNPIEISLSDYKRFHHAPAEEFIGSRKSRQRRAAGDFQLADPAPAL